MTDTMNDDLNQKYPISDPQETQRIDVSAYQQSAGNPTPDEEYPTFNDQVPAAQQPGAAKKQKPNTKVKKVKVPGPYRWRFVFLGLFFMAIAMGIGGWVGYNKGIEDRLGKKSKEVLTIAATQYELAMDDMANGRYEIARQRLEYVLQIDSSYPDAATKLAEVMLVSPSTGNEVEVNLADLAQVIVEVTATPQVTSTPDWRTSEQIYRSAVELINSSQWDAAIAQLDTLRKTSPSYRAIDVDGMYYLALGSRGKTKIGRGNLEEGLYDLAIAERFGPLDKEAQGLQNLARMYLTASSFWGLDWGQCVSYFQEVAAASPGMVDASGVSASQRLREAAVSYADQLVTDNVWCGEDGAEGYYKVALDNGADKTIAATATAVGVSCNGPAETSTPVPSVATVEVINTLPPSLVDATATPAVVPPISDPSIPITP